MRIAGRFHKVFENDEYMVVGFLGSASVFGIGAAQIDYVRGFYNNAGHQCEKVRLPREEWGDYVNKRYYNDYLVISKTDREQPDEQSESQGVIALPRWRREYYDEHGYHW